MCRGFAGFRSRCSRSHRRSSSSSSSSPLPSPFQERQFLPLLRLLFRLHLSVRRPRPANHRHHRLGNVVTGFMTFCALCGSASRACPTARLTLSPVLCPLSSQWLDRSSDWSEHQYPSGHHHVTDRCSVHRSVRLLPHHV